MAAVSTQRSQPTATLVPSSTPITLPFPRQVRVGAIRWDAWSGDLLSLGGATGESSAGLVVERTLGPAHWHDRLPFYAVELAADRVQVRGATQDIMDREIAYAAGAGLDYLAFVYYAPGSGLDIARELYLTSTHRADLRFCLIFDSLPRLQEALDRNLLRRYFAMPEYETVPGGRPLLYLFGFDPVSQEVIDATRAAVAEVRVQAVEAGAGDPYLVHMGWQAETVALVIETYGLDAGSAYAEAGANGIPFAQLARYAELRWESYRRAGLKVVPWVTSGWDPRPRIETLIPWHTYDPNGWAQPGTPEEIAAHLQHAVLWSADHPDAAEAQSIIIYAWNEFDEGGWLCPTLRDGTARLDALAPILRPAGGSDAQ